MKFRSWTQTVGLTLLIFAGLATSQAQKGGTPPPDPAFAYAAFNRSGGGLYVMNADETNRRVILNQGDTVVSGDLAGTVEGIGGSRPSFSPTGDRIAFRTTVTANGQAVDGICTVNTTGPHGFRMIARSLRSHVSGHAPSWSPANVMGQGDFVAYVDWLPSPTGGTGHRAVFVARPDGSEAYPLFDPVPGLLGVEDSLESVSWSPDGTRIVVEAWDRLYLLPLGVVDGSLSVDPAQAVDLTPPGSRIFSGRKAHVAWANAHDKIAVSFSADGVNNDIWVVEPYLLEPRVDPLGNSVLVPRATPVTATTTTSETGPTWSPDDRTVFFGTAWNSALQKRNADGSGKTTNLATKGHYPNRRRF